MRTLRLITFSRPTSLLAAQHRGFLEEEGLALEVEDAKGSRSQMEGLAEGRWDLAHTNADNVMKFRQNGFEQFFIFFVLDLGMAQKVIVQPDVATWDDLRGRAVGVDAADSGYAFVLYDLLRRSGLTPDDYEVKALGATAYRLQGLRDGEIAAGLLSHHHEVSALADGFRILEDTRDVFPGMPGVTGVATTDWASRNEEALHGYARALWCAFHWTQDPANRADVVRVVMEARGMTEEAATELVGIEFEARTAAVHTIAQMEASLAETAALRATYTGHAPTGYFSPTVMEQVLGAD